MDRRKFLWSAGTGIVSAGLLGRSLAAEGSRSAADIAAATDTIERQDSGVTGPLREFRLVAQQGEAEVAPGKVYQTWLYNGQFPGPEIRVKEGEQLRIIVENQLPEETTVHWHGVPVPNAMDGVPGLTQKPIAPGESFVYKFEATPAGSYIYHSHVGLQIDRGLIGPLVIEEATPHVTYDRDYALVLDDYLPGDPQPLGGMGGRRGMMGRTMGDGCNDGWWGGNRQGGGMMGGWMDMERQMPPYQGLLIGGRLPDDPQVFETKRGERVRLRLINPSGATTVRAAIGGHRMMVTHCDGRPVEPVTVDSLVLGAAERYDVIVEATNPGVWPIVIAAIEGNAPPGRAVLRYTDAAASALRDGVPEGFRGGRQLYYQDLQGLETLPAGRPDRVFDLMLRGGMMGSAWTINGQAYPAADPLMINKGERIRFRMSNHSMMLHPMHLHGHFFRVGNALKDTVLVGAHMGRAEFDFVADNPGRWFFHCHNIYHMEAGMAREVRYA
ncbi:multicopper oxidase family protein [Thalassospira profundimaris]|uniref:multicopper oxidase family protein n=1 Tax=Thalassospira profundimaris TaxID=502049 RepID=UPI000DED4A1A|nr:multicopper oxidase family protein [Thalassospira profundimaris]